MATPKPPYTVGLWFGTNTASGVTGGPLVPSGYQWVIRNVDLLTPGYLFDGVGPWYLKSERNGFLMGWGAGQISGAASYSWEGRQVITEGDGLQVNTSRSGFAWAVSGYQLLTV